MKRTEMSNFQEHYKGKTYGFGKTNEGRLIRAAKCEGLRKDQRTQIFNRNRKISESVTNTPLRKEVQLRSLKEDRLTRLRKWKIEREKQNKKEKAKKKPPFKVGVVHHKLYSPTNNNNAPASTVALQKGANGKRVTRATEKRLEAKAKVENKTKRTVIKGVKKEKDIKKSDISFAPKNHSFKAPAGIPSIPLFGRIAVPPMSPANVNRSFAFSPFRSSRRSSKLLVVVENMNIKENIPQNVDSSKNSGGDIKKSSAETSMKSPSDEQELNSSVKNETQEKNTPVNNKSVTSDAASDPAYFSPYVVSSRGKKNARKEQQIRRGFSLDHSTADGIPTKDTVMETLNISVDDEERTSQYFQFLLSKERDRLSKLCDKWTEIKAECDVTEDAHYLINQAVGQTHLLINKKFERFRGLVTDCESGLGEMLVTCKDLQGFWDMMYMEVRDCDSRFEKLEQLRSSGWVEERPVVKAVVRKKAATKKKVAPAKPSNVRTFLAERKKKMAQTKELDTLNQQNSNNSLKESENLSTGYTRRSKSINTGPQKTPIKREGKRLSLLQKVQLSTISKKESTPLTVIKVTQMYKTPEVKLDETITYVNCDQTPRKSILKQRNQSELSELRLKQTHKVNFNDTIVLNEVEVDEDTRVKMDLARALERINSFDLDSIDNDRTIERKLEFDDDSFEESSDPQDEIVSSSPANVPLIVHTADGDEESPEVESSTIKFESNNSNKKAEDEVPLQTVLDNMNSVLTLPSKDLKRRSLIPLKRQVATVEESDSNENNTSVRTLRNRSICLVETSTTKNTYSEKDLSNGDKAEHKENKTPSRTRRKSSLKVSAKDNNNRKASLEDGINNISLDDKNDKKRRSRRSVKFTEKDCTGCTEGKAALPMTPHVRRSMAKISEKKTPLPADLISWETPKNPPPRVRRSQYK